MVAELEKPGTWQMGTDGWTLCTDLSTHLRGSGSTAPSYTRANRRVKGPEVTSHEKLGRLSLEKKEAK